MFSVAPMMGVTHRFARHLYRIMSRSACFYTEMVAVSALAHGKCWERTEDANSVLQVGGSDIRMLRAIAPKIEEQGWSAVNLNVGCPSDKVQSGKWGACLMKEPALVADCVTALSDILSIPVTVKCRIGIDSDTGDARIKELLSRLADVNCSEVIIHARNAILKGLSPARNRVVPPLDYNLVYRMKEMFPKLQVVVNGGIDTLEDAMRHLKYVDGVMLGRAIKRDPFMLTQVDSFFYQDHSRKITRAEVVEKFFDYAAVEVEKDINAIKTIIQTIIPIAHGLPRAAEWRRKLTENGNLQINLVREHLLDLCYSPGSEHGV